MTTTPPKEIGASVRARLSRLARERGESFQFVLTRYANERLLFRLASSRHAQRFVLKGATLFTLWTGKPHRATRDLDLLGFGDPGVDHMREVFPLLFPWSLGVLGVMAVRFPARLPAVVLRRCGARAGLRLRRLTAYPGDTRDLRAAEDTAAGDEARRAHGGVRRGSLEEDAVVRLRAQGRRRRCRKPRRDRRGGASVRRDSARVGGEWHPRRWHVASVRGVGVSGYQRRASSFPSTMARIAASFSNIALIASRK
ncbi:nucleotidyl transferase AbiEii/AbiGii toxin family protein [Sorangium sp. So ce1097]|uniref:nucleotidyl transferase AbiEii/AbiGii toxin family protein n=1 Tax=Sorangium sp. So ce1097 TaxID=3133330 RepID=UPI003F5FEF5F